ncbi:hypothetical protein [uncultured Pontibacter sp.]|uniref:hypothetical protein n=1 Tax=uncultured Pontibacter sp. TaxID=453356 RepID=UPI002610F6D5|nr:hypothetical protein [uncultured Pontibacter sp.]
MKHFSISYSDNWRSFPMAYWVHIEQDGVPWYAAQAFDPPAPQKNANGMYKIYHIEVDGFTFVFSSVEQLDHCIDILSMKLLPTTRALSEKRPGHMGPNSHWLSRLPAHVKPWSYRQKAVKYLSKIKDELKHTK